MARNKATRLASPLPKGTVACGDLTLDPSQPHNNIIPFPSNLTLDTRSAPIKDIHTLQGTGVAADVGVQLTTFLKAQAQALHLDQIIINAPQATRYLVYNSETSFREACGSEVIRTWLKEHVLDEGRTAAMVVGMYTYSNASYTHTHSNQLGGRASGTIPTGTINANTIGGAHAAALNHQAFNMPEEHIFAIEYKNVKFKAWAKKKVEEAKLEQKPNRWEVFFGDRSKGAPEEDIENIFEFNLDDDEESEEDKMDDIVQEKKDLRFQGSVV